VYNKFTSKETIKKIHLPCLRARRIKILILNFLLKVTEQRNRGKVKTRACDNPVILDTPHE
jgi:hypothetical protein